MEKVGADRRWRLAVIAAAFELPVRAVVVDALAVHRCPRADPTTLRWLRRRHGWDDSVAPYYLAHLRRLLRAPAGRAR